VLGEIDQENELVAMSSKFGLLISGPIKNSDENNIVMHSNLVVQGPSTIPASLDGECKLENELQCFWDIESLGTVDETFNESDMENFPSQVIYDFLKGCYKVGLPWKLSKSKSTSYALCIR